MTARGRGPRAQERNLRLREVIAAEWQAQALAQIATAMEKQNQNQMNEEMAQPLRVRVDGQPDKAKTVLTTPAPRIPKLEERAEPGGLDDDEIEPLSDKS